MAILNRICYLIEHEELVEGRASAKLVRNYTIPIILGFLQVVMGFVGLAK